MSSRLRLGTVAVCMLLVAACGGGAASTTPPAATGTPAGPTATAAGATGSPAAASPTATPAATPTVNCTDSKPSSPAPSGLPTGLSGTLTVWEAYGASGSSERNAFCTMVANVKAANPGLTVNVLDYPFNALFNTFALQAASGGGPDLYIAPNDSLPSQARASLLNDLSGKMAQLKAAPYNISDVALTADTVDGKLFAIPESMKAVALFYRTDMLATAPATTDDWLKPANAAKLGLVYGSNGGGAYYQWGFYGAFGGTILSADGHCAATANTGVADSMDFLTKFKAAGGHLYKNDTDAKNDFLSGKIGGFIDGPWQSGDLSKALGNKLAVAPGPKGAGGPFQPMAAPDSFYINASSSNTDLATQFALAMLTPANEQVFVDTAGHIPANTTMKISDPIAAGFQTAITTGFPRPTAKQLDNYWGNFGNAIAAVVDAGTAATQAVQTACQKMDQANGL